MCHWPATVHFWVRECILVDVSLIWERSFTGSWDNWLCSNQSSQAMLCKWKQITEEAKGAKCWELECKSLSLSLLRQHTVFLEILILFTACPVYALFQKFSLRCQWGPLQMKLQYLGHNFYVEEVTLSQEIITPKDHTVTEKRGKKSSFPPSVQWQWQSSFKH